MIYLVIRSARHLRTYEIINAGWIEVSSVSYSKKENYKFKEPVHELNF